MVRYDSGAGSLRGALCWEVRGVTGGEGAGIDLEGGAGCGVEIKGAFGRVKGGGEGEGTLVLLGGFNTQKRVMEPTWESGWWGGGQ